MNIEIPDKVNEICVIAPSQELADNSRMVAKKLGYDNVSFFVGALNNGLEIAMKAKERGAEVFVSRKGTADLIEKIGDFQVVNIRTTMNDYLRHIHLLKEHKGTLGIVEYIKYIPELQKLCKYIELDNVNLYAYSNSSDYEIAAKKVQATMDTKEIPPEIQPTKLSANFTKRLESPPLAIKSPARKKAGKANILKLSQPENIFCVIKANDKLGSIIKATIIAPPKDQVIGIPITIMTTKAKSIQIAATSMALLLMFLIIF